MVRGSLWEMELTYREKAAIDHAKTFWRHGLFPDYYGISYFTVLFD